MNYADTLADWLEAYHDHARPPPAVVLAEASRVTEQKTGRPLKGIEIPPPQNGSNGNGNARKDEDAPPVRDPPVFLGDFFNEMKAHFEQAKKLASPAEAIHVASLIQEVSPCVEEIS